MKVENHNVVGIVTLALMLALLLFAASLVYSKNPDLSRSVIINLAFDMFGIILCTVIFASTLLDQRITTSTVVFMCLLTLVELLLFWDIENWIIDGHPEKRQFNKIVNYYIYGLMITVIVAFWCYLRVIYDQHVEEFKKLTTYIYILFAIGMGLILTNPWTHLYFIIDETGTYVRSDTFWISYITPLLTGSICLYALLRYRQKKRRTIALVSYVIFPFLASMVQLFHYGISLQYVSLAFSLLLMYANIYIDRSTELIHNESEMTEQRASVMVSQIQPHFLYNSLTSIMNIKGNPPETIDAIADFGHYMRGNLDSITQITPIPISKELEQVECYINLRKIKYGDRVNINIDVTDKEIFLPPMTLKTIVGSMIEYNIRTNDSKIDARIYTESNTANHVVVFENNSPSIESIEFVAGDNDQIVYMRQRLETMVRGQIYTITENDNIRTSIVIPRNTRDRS